MAMVMRHRDKHLGLAPDLGQSNKEAAVAHTHMHSLNAPLCTLCTFVHTHVHSLNALVCSVHCLHLCTALLYTHTRALS